MLGRGLDVNPTKIVAGKEVGRTNEFLQAIAEAATKKVDNDVMVKRFLSRGTANETNAAPPAAKSSKATTKTGAAQPSRGKERHKENEKSKRPEPKEEPAAEDRPGDTTNLKNRPREAGRERGNTQKDDDLSDAEEKKSEQASRGRMARPPSARGRQPSSRGGRPEPEVNGHSAERGSADRINSGNKPSNLATRAAADVIPKSKVVIQQAKGDDSDEEDDFVVREAGPGALPIGNNESTAASLMDAENDQHGALVQKIIETTNALDAKTGVKTTKLSPAEEAALRRQRETVAKEMERLCSSIQNSARLAAPLARLAELVQEDLDAMNTELTMWRSENRKASEMLAQVANPSMGKQSASQKVKAAAAATNEALRGQLREYDSQIAELSETIAAVRGNCIRNEQRISAMLSGGTAGGTVNARY